MLTLKKLTPYDHEHRDLIMPGAYFLQTEDGLDWYYHLTRFAEDTVKIAYDDSGVVRFIETDASKIWPANLSVVELSSDRVPAEANNTGNWSYSNGSVVPRIYTASELTIRAEAQREKLIAAARTTMNEWQNDLLLDEISDEDRASLKMWNGYVKALKAVIISSPAEIVWPAPPEPASI